MVDVVEVICIIIKSTCYNDSLSSVMSESKNTYCDGVVERFSIETDFLNILVGMVERQEVRTKMVHPMNMSLTMSMIDSDLKAEGIIFCELGKGYWFLSCYFFNCIKYIR